MAMALVLLTNRATSARIIGGCRRCGFDRAFLVCRVLRQMRVVNDMKPGVRKGAPLRVWRKLAYHCAMPTLYLFHFPYFDPLHNKWLTARFVAQHEEIAQRYAQYEIVGEPETRHVPDDWLYADASQVARSAQ
jgi:hypothetical protein